MTTIQSEHFTKALNMLLDETFDNVHGFFLDKHTSLFETLATISAEQASIPVGGKCATLAAQVKHVAFFLDFTEKSVNDPNLPPVDWGEIWRTVSAVTPAEWQAIQDELRQRYDSILRMINTWPEWHNEWEVAGAITVAVHTAYHLGEIRQALCTLRP